MSDYPERISISPTFRQKREDDFFLVDRKAFPGKGIEYIRADLALDPLADPRVKALVEALRNGALVRYEDYAALQARIAEVEKERDREKAYAAELEVKLAKAVELAEKYQHAFAAQSRKLQAVLHIDGVRAALAAIQEGRG